MLNLKKCSKELIGFILFNYPYLIFSWCLPLSEMKRRYRIAEEVQEVPDYFTNIIHGLNSMRINSVYWWHICKKIDYK